MTLSSFTMVGTVPLPRTSVLCRPFSTNYTCSKQFRSGRKDSIWQSAVCKADTKSMEISVVADEGMPPLTQVFPVSDSSKLYTASLKKPLGLTLAEQGGNIIVEKVMDEGNGNKADIKVGDIVRGTTARSKNIQQESVQTVEARNKQSFLGGLVLLRTDGEDFDTVIAAIQSSKCSTCDVTLVLERQS